MEKSKIIAQYLKKCRRENMLILLFIMFISASANFLQVHYLTLLVVFAYTFWIFMKRGQEIDVSIILFIITYVLSIIIYYLSFGWIDIMLSLRMLLIFVLGYLVVEVLQLYFYEFYEQILYVLSLFSLVIFPFQLLYYKQTYSILELIQNNLPIMGFTNAIGTNVVIYSIDNEAQTRNSGFAWEPKGFGNFLIIAIIINLIRNRFKINKKLIVYILATITTFSTTAYLCLFFIIPMFYMLNVNKSYLLLFIPLALISAILILKLEFMQVKIEREWSNRDEYKTLLADSRTYEARSLGRMPSMLVDMMDFKKQPLFGYGMQRKERQQSIYTHLVRVNGLSDWLATFGIIGFIFFICSHYYGFKKYLDYYSLTGSVILVLAIMVIYFASNVIRHPFWTILLFIFVINYKSPNAKFI